MTIPRAGRVLIMDDDRNVRETLGQVLQHLGYEPGYAASGEEAIATYAQAAEQGTRFDVVIVDLTVPGSMGGVETLRGILSLDPHAKVVLSTGYSGDPAMAECRKLGFAGAIAKPFPLQELEQLMTRLMRT